jgi:hypothetical protein
MNVKERIDEKKSDGGLERRLPKKKLVEGIILERACLCELLNLILLTFH